MRVKLIPPGSGFARLTEAVTTEYGQLLDLVRQAIRDKLRLSANGGDFYADVRGIWPDRVVVQYKGRLYSYPYILTVDNTVALGEAQEVVADYAPVGTAPAPVREAEAAFREAADGSIEVTLIRAGRSGNRNYYPDAALREAAPMFEGVRVFAKSDAEHIAGKGKDVRNLIGGIYSVRFIEGTVPIAAHWWARLKPSTPAMPLSPRWSRPSSAACSPCWACRLTLMPAPGRAKPGRSSCAKPCAL